MSIKFIHCADVHLGSPLVAASKEKQDLLNDAIENALKNMVDLAIDEKVDFVVIAGDLFDGKMTNASIGRKFKSIMKPLEENKIYTYVLFGNHDAEGKHSLTFSNSEYMKFFSADNAETFKIEDDFTSSYIPNFEGLECRWEDIKTPKEETISILIKSLNENSNEIYQNSLKQIEKIAGSHDERNPLKYTTQLNLSFNPKMLNTEASIFAKNKISKFFIILKLMFENFLGLVLTKYSIGLWGNYKNRIIKTTDTEKFDDMLRMVITTTKKQSLELENYLQKE